MTSPTKSIANGYTLPHFVVFLTKKLKAPMPAMPLWILEVIWSPCGYNVLALILHEKLPTWCLTDNMKRLCCRSRLRYNQLSLGLYKVAQLIVLEVSMIGKIAVENLWQTPGKESQHRSLRFWRKVIPSKAENYIHTFGKPAWALVETECLLIGHQVTIHLEMSFRSWILFDLQSQKVSNNPL